MKSVRWWLGKAPRELALPPLDLKVAVIIPAYEKAAVITEVIESVLSQTYPLAHVIVIDDCSQDGTGELARKLPVTVLTTPTNRGSKAGAQNFALDYILEQGIDIDVFVTLDGDTTLRSDSIAEILRAFNYPTTIIASGSIVSKYIETIWERGRHVQHLINAALIRPSQSHNDALLVASGCFGAYHLQRFLEVLGRFPEDTIVEDLEATLRTHEHRRYRVFYMPHAVSYTIDPRDFQTLVSQLERWYRGFVRSLIQRKGNMFRISVDVGIDICFFLFFLVLGPLMLPLALYAALSGALGGLVQTLLVVYLFGASLIVLVVGWRAYRLGLLWKTLTSIPALFVVQFVDLFMYARAFYVEVIKGEEIRDWDPFAKSSKET